MKTELDKGYLNPHLPPENYHQRQGVEQYFRDQERKQQERDAQNRARSPSPTFDLGPTQTIWTGPTTYGGGGGSGGSSTPTTLANTMQGCAFFGALIGVLYAFVGLDASGWAEAIGGALAGAVLGSVAGIPLYLTIVVLRVVVMIVAWVLKIAVICGMAFVAFQMFAALAG